MNFGLNLTLASTKGGYQYMKMRSAYEKKIYRALPFWYAITGCDTVPAFSGRGKKKAWDGKGVFEEVTRSFIR